MLSSHGTGQKDPVEMLHAGQELSGEHAGKATEAGPVLPLFVVPDCPSSDTQQGVERFGHSPAAGFQKEPLFLPEEEVHNSSRRELTLQCC